MEQAKQFGIAGSETRALARLRALERAGFLRRVAVYPVVYQITGSTTRMLGADRRARRTHTTETVLHRLLAVNFYLEARGGRAKFVFDHDAKVAAFLDEGCPRNALPHRGGEPYLWEELVLWLGDGRIGIALVDRQHRSPFWQLWGFAKRFCRLTPLLGERLELLIVTGTNVRHRHYARFARHPALQKLARPGSRIIIKPSLVQRSTKSLQLLAPLSQSLFPTDEEPISDAATRGL